jgi:Uma2 family endonuclease
MATVITPVPAESPPACPPANLPDGDGIPLETFWHYVQIALLADTFYYLWRDRDDFYIAGNMFFYYSMRQVRGEKFVGPDFFYVKNTDRHRKRNYWAVWDEDGKYPNVIIELLSPTTAKIDRTKKKDLYEKTFRLPEYFIYDPDTHQVEGWRLVDRKFQDLSPNEQGWIWSEEMGVWLGNWEGEYLGQHGIYLRAFDRDGRLCPLHAEAAQQHVETERQRADVERQRAEAAESEVARLRALLAQQARPAKEP